MCTMQINAPLKGIELSFESKPSRETLDTIKAAGFRWHRRKKLWYAKQNAERLALATALAENPQGENPAGHSPEAPAAENPAPATVSKYGIKAGDILTGSWGYSMTLPEIWKVKKIVSPCRVEIVEIGARVVSCDRSGGEKLLPDPETERGGSQIKTVMKDRGGYTADPDTWYIKINDYCRLRPWDGREIYRNTWD